MSLGLATTLWFVGTLLHARNVSNIKLSQVNVKVVKPSCLCFFFLTVMFYFQSLLLKGHHNTDIMNVRHHEFIYDVLVDGRRSAFRR